MILSISKGEEKGLLGGIKFTVSAKVKLTDEERALIKRFKLDKEALIVRESKSFFSEKYKEQPITIGYFIQGIACKCASVDEIYHRETLIMDQCKAFKDYLDVLTTFDEDIVVEF